MAKSITKTYRIKIRYAFDDGQDFNYTNPAYKELKKYIVDKIGKVVPVSKGILSAHVDGEIKES